MLIDMSCNVARKTDKENSILCETFEFFLLEQKYAYLCSVKTIKYFITMKKIILSVALMAVSFITISAQSFSTISNSSNDTFRSSRQSQFSSVNANSRYQNSYTRSDGTYVQGHMKTESNRTNHDNYSTSGNTNPFTGTVGARARDYSSQSYNYGSGRTIQTGSRGGQYYVNSNGNKTYVPKRYY